MQRHTNPVGCDGIRSKRLKTQTKAIYAAQTKINTNILSLIAVAFIGIGIIAVAGHVQAATLHDAAHDMRHATGFPCH